MKKLLTGLLITLLLISEPLHANTTVKYIKDGVRKEIEKETDYDAIAVVNGDKIKHVSQLGTGIYSNINCGPACVAMLGKYFNKDISITDLNSLKPSTKGYSALNLKQMLVRYRIQPTLGDCKKPGSDTVQEDCLVNYLEQGNIILLAIDTQYIRMKGSKPSTVTTDFETFIGRTYEGNFYHFILCTGYLQIAGHIYYQLLDPLEEGYSYVSASDLSKAILGNWSNCFLFKFN